MLHHLAPSCTILHHLAPSCTMLHHVAPCCTMLHHAKKWDFGRPNPKKETAFFYILYPQKWRIIYYPRHPSHLYQDPDSISRVFLEKVVVVDFHRTRVRSLAMLVTHSLPNSLPNSVTLSKLYWCDPGVWRCQLKTYWGCCCCWCWWWVSCWQQLVADLEAKVWS